MVASFLVLSLSFVLLGGASAQTVGMKFPAPAGTQWEVLAGYNTATHEGVDPYALDVWRTDGETGGTPLLAPFSGTLGYVSDTCVAVLTSEVDLLMCHVFVDAGLERGNQVVEGQRLGIVAPDGEGENAGIAHIHLQLNVRDDAPGSTGASLPFSGAHAIEGIDLPATTTFNGYAGQEFTSTNAQVAGSPSVFTPAPPEPAPPSILAGEVFVGGVSLVVYSGGSTADLMSEIACPLPELGIWASAPNGNLVQYTVGRPAFVNAGWTALFPGGLPGVTPLLVKCG